MVLWECSEQRGDSESLMKCLTHLPRLLHIPRAAGRARRGLAPSQAPPYQAAPARSRIPTPSTARAATFASAVQSPSLRYKELSRNRLYGSVLNLSYKNIHEVHGYLQLPPTSCAVMLSGVSP